MQNNTTLLDDENLTVEEAGVEDNQQILIEGETYSLYLILIEGETYSLYLILIEGETYSLYLILSNWS